MAYAKTGTWHTHDGGWGEDPVFSSDLDGTVPGSKHSKRNDFRALIRHAYERVPHYRRSFERAGIHADDVRSLADLARIPLTSRSDLQSLPARDVIAAGFDPKKMVLHLTSGSSGQPLTVRRTKARLRERRPAGGFPGADARGLPLRNASLDLVLSTSTLDHFDSRREFVAAIAEIARVLRPGGRLVLTIDNPSNPLYWPLRWLGRTRWLPFPFGYSPSRSSLRELLGAAGLEVIACETLIHNPRIVSTVLFLALRRLLRDRADLAIRGLLAAFEVLERLPTRGLTACFLATCAVRSTMPPHDPEASDVIST